MSSKLVPPSTDGAVARPRLFDLVDAARARPVIWVGAPAGSGKSMLLATYLRDRKANAIWCSLDRSVAEASSLVRFWEQLPPDGMLVLDGFPEYSSATAALYELALEASQVGSVRRNLVLLSRSCLPARLARLLAESKLSLIGWENLDFSSEEGRQLARQRACNSGFTLAERQEHELLRHAHGWAASIVLSVECARLGPHSSCPLLGSAEISAYFAEELWQHTDAELRQFALETAFLPELRPEWLELLYPGAIGEVLLQRFAAQHPFAFELDTERRGRKYSRHIREFLLTRARREWGAGGVATRQERIGQLLAACDEFDAGLALLCEASALDAAAVVLARLAPRAITEGPACTLVHYLEKLPLELIRSSGWLSLWSACLQYGTNPENASQLAELAFETFDPATEPNGYWLAWRTLLLSHNVDERGAARANELIQLGIEALRCGSFNDDELELSVCRAVAFTATNLLPDHPGVRECAERVLTGPPCASAEQLAVAIFYLGFNGELAELAAVNARWRAQCVRLEQGPETQLWVALGELFHALFSGNFAQAQRVAAAGFELAESAGAAGSTSTLLTMWAYSCLAQDDEPQLMRVLEKMERIPGAERRLQLANYRFVSGVQALTRGESERARQFLHQAYLTAQRMEVPLAESLHGLGLCEALLNLSEHEAALQLLERVMQRIPRACVIVRQAAGFLSAALRLAVGDAAAANQELSRALLMGKDKGFLPLPLPSRPLLAQLLERAIQLGIESDRARELVRALSLPATSAGPGNFEVVPSSRRAVPRSFVASVRDGLRRLHETEPLLNSPLLKSPLFGGLAREQRVKRLRELLIQQVQLLQANVRTEPYYRVLRHTFVQAAGTQLLAAERAGMSFGTYRRHLQAGIQEVAANLWILTHATDAAPSSRRRRIGHNAMLSG